MISHCGAQICERLAILGTPPSPLSAPAKKTVLFHKAHKAFCRNTVMLERLFYDIDFAPCFDCHLSPEDAALECVIVEPRDHQNLKPVLRNVSHMLPHTALTVFCSKENANIVHDIVNVNGPNRVRIHPLFEGNIDRVRYNNLLTSPEFWDLCKSPKVLVFQTDTGVLYNNILRFMEYDYIGAPWSWPIYNDPNIYVGNGGFSLRTRSMMRDISSRYQRNPHWPDPVTGGEPEDIFFGWHLRHMDQAKLPTYDIASHFSVEHNCHENPMGFHQAYGFHNEEIVRKWFSPDVMDSPHAYRPISIMDAWIESENGRQYSSEYMKRWLATGIGPSGFTMEKDTLVDCVDNNDIDPGSRKYLKILFSNAKKAVIPLYQNRCSACVKVTP